MNDIVTTVNRDARGEEFSGRHALLKASREVIIIRGYTDKGWIVELAHPTMQFNPALRVEVSGTELELQTHRSNKEETV